MAGAYVVCGGGGAYLGVVVACAAGSVSYVLAKAAAVLPRRAAALQAGAGGDARAAAGPEAMLLLSLALAAAHLAAAYRTSCRERRRMLVYRIDVEGAVSVPSQILTNSLHPRYLPSDPNCTRFSAHEIFTSEQRKYHANNFLLFLLEIEKKNFLRA
jgi:hypothetical protein